MSTKENLHLDTAQPFSIPESLYFVNSKMKKALTLSDFEESLSKPEDGRVKDDWRVYLKENLFSSPQIAQDETAKIDHDDDSGRCLEKKEQYSASIIKDEDEHISLLKKAQTSVVHPINNSQTGNNKSAVCKKNKNSNRSNSKKLKEVSVLKHMISLRIFKLFQDEPVMDIIEKKIREILSSAPNLQISDQETKSFSGRGETEFKFSISNISLIKAKQCLKQVASEVKVEMNAKWFTYGIQQTRSLVKSSDGKLSEEKSEKSNAAGKLRSVKYDQNGENLELNSQKQQSRLKEEIEKTYNNIEIRIEGVLETQKANSERVEKEIDRYNLKECDLEFLSQRENDDRYALSHKLAEMKMQRFEFIQRYNKISEKLRSLDVKKAKLEDISKIQKAVGIECNRLKIALPIYARRRDIENQIQSHQVSVILGETGSGKSTQLAQFLYEAGFAQNGTIVCTQPRRIAAITLADRVANEMVESVGGLVGYKSGFSKKCGNNTKIIFTTDHSLLNECLNDPKLEKYSCIIVDEAHERSIYTDILLGIIKNCLHERDDLKVIITSATIDPEVFIKYFDSGPELRVSGRTFPIELFYEDGSDGEDFEKYEEKAVAKAMEIVLNEGHGDVLVFLCTPAEIMRCCEEFGKRCKASGKTNVQCYPLHGQLPPEEQKKVFEKLSPEKRKVVFATNCAETSITIDGIKFVIDIGVAKEMKYDPRRNMNQLGIHAISKSSADQRKGRAGRTASGKCFRLYTRDGYDAMENLNDPEILRVHLGQAVLKLSELGIDVRSYDFVQAPSANALKSAIETLEYVGAIADGQITHIGRWISKLPFDPKIGFMVYEAQKNGLLYDAVVLAGVLSSGSDLFYRGFSESEAQVVARSKIYFGSNYGDTFTWLQVYKAWTDVKNDEKSSWCRSHCINYKCLNYVKKTIKDVNSVLERDLGIHMDFQFSHELEAVNKLRKILFQATADSISNFSEVFRAGYYTLIQEQQVHMHPSSILVALNLNPEWIVYTNLIRTSKEFVKGTTVVEEEWIHELVNTGKLSIDVMKAKENKFSCVHGEEVGSTVFRALVGPCFSNLQVLEGDLVNTGIQRLVLEAIRDTGVFNIHSPFPMNQTAVDLLNRVKAPAKKKLLSEDFEFNLNRKESIVSSGTRVIIGKGGCVKNILMPNQSDKVLIKRIHETVTEESILKKFKEFGEIKDIIQFKSYDPWGFIRYGSIAEAVAAVEATSGDVCCAGSLKLDKFAKHAKNMFEAKLTWVRRPIKGRGTAFVKCSPLDQPMLIGHSILCLGKICQIKMSRKDDLIIFETGSLKEEEIKDKLCNLMESLNLDTKALTVQVLRENIPLSVEDIQRKIDEISSFVKRYIQEDSFKINILKPNQRSIYYVCFVNFIDPVRGYHICKRMGIDLQIDGQIVEVNPSLKTTVHVPQRLKTVCDERFEDLFKGLEKHKATQLRWISLKKDFAIEIKCSRPSYIVEARDLLCKEMEGEVIDCNINETLSCLLNKIGQDFLQKTEKKNGCVIITDFRNGKIHIYGCESKVSKTQCDINTFLDEIVGSEQKLFLMKGPDKPPGVMKLAVRKYGPLLEGLVSEFSLKSVNINWRKHSVHVVGPAASLEKACNSLSDVVREAWNEFGNQQETSLPDCSVCNFPIETKESLLRLEFCGHAYCSDCLQHQVTCSVNNKDFPLSCASDGCDSLFVWRDIKFVMSRKWIREDKLVSMAVNAFVMENKDRYKFCLTPNCPIVYEVTKDINGREFNCPICFASICTSCHIAFHAGMSCLMSKSQTQAESELDAWVAQNPANRKLCPGCKSPIEKIEGCNKMQCTSCRTYFCWLCQKIASTQDECYKHLMSVHGSFI